METSRHRRTHERLIACALDLFEAQGFERTTVAQIASAAGVTEMTFFRHFAGKESVVLSDPYDPAIAEAIGAQPVDDGALVRTAGGIRQAFHGLPEPETELVRRRVRIIASSATLRASSAASNLGTERSISDRLVADGAPVLAARTAAAAVLAALTAALYEWGSDERLTMSGAIDGALDALEGRDG